MQLDTQSAMLPKSLKIASDVYCPSCAGATFIRDNTVPATVNPSHTASVDAVMAGVSKDLHLWFVKLLLIVLTLVLPLVLLRDVAFATWLLPIHCATYFILLVVHLGRHRLPSVWPAGVAVALLYLLGTLSLIAYGITSASMLAYALIAIIVPIAFGRQCGLAAAIVCGATYILIGALTQSGYLTYDIKQLSYQNSATNWMFIGVCLGCFASFVLLLGSKLRMRIYSLIESESERAHALEAVNEKLADTNQRLRSLNDELEDRVQERTAKLQEINRELSVANRDLETFSYMASHDLRAPLRAIGGFSALLAAEDENLSARSQGYLERIQQSTERLQNMIEQVLKFSRAGRSEITRISTNLSEVAKAVLEELKVGEPQRAVKLDIAANLWASADPVMIRELLQNLLCNAWKFTAKTQRACIHFGMRQENGQTVHYVQDNGAGFDPENSAKLFRPFQRLHSEREFAGTGIGLAIAQCIVERHGGRLWAQGKPGEGATFSFTLPNSSAA